jgi:hypothetical protein
LEECGEKCAVVVHWRRSTPRLLGLQQHRCGPNQIGKCRNSNSRIMARTANDGPTRSKHATGTLHFSLLPRKSIVQDVKFLRTFTRPRSLGYHPQVVSFGNVGLICFLKAFYNGEDTITPERKKGTHAAKPRPNTTPLQGLHTVRAIGSRMAIGNCEREKGTNMKHDAPYSRRNVRWLYIGVGQRLVCSGYNNIEVAPIKSGSVATRIHELWHGLHECAVV